MPHRNRDVQTFEANALLERLLDVRYARGYPRTHRLVSPPPDTFALVSTSKSLFRSAAKQGPLPLGVKLVQAALRRHLDESLEDISSQTMRVSYETVGKRRAFTLGDLFLPRLVKTTKRKPQVLLSGSLAVMSVMGVPVSDDKWKHMDVDIFCTWEPAPFGRQRLIERCGLICSGVDNSDKQEGGDLSAKFGAPDFFNCVQTALSHVENYSSRPTEGKSGEDDFDDDDEAPDRLEYTSDAYFARACEWGATVDTSHRPVGVPGGSAGGAFPHDGNCATKVSSSSLSAVRV